MEAYVAPYVQVRHAIHLLYATSPRSRDGAGEAAPDSEAELNGPDEQAASREPDGDASEPTSVRKGVPAKSRRSLGLRGEYLGGPMSVHRGTSGPRGRKRKDRHPGGISEAAPGGELRVGAPGQRPGDLPAGPVGRAGAGAAQPAAGPRSASAGADAVFDVGGVRAGRPGPDHAGNGAAPADRNRNSVDGGRDRNGITRGNLARGQMGQLQHRRARALYRIR